MGVAINYPFSTWIAVYPQFTSTVSQAQFDGLVFPVATQNHANDGSGPVTTSDAQTVLLGLMCSHVAQLLFGSSTQPLSALVGRISNATEGGVTVAAEMPAAPNAIQAWLNQTQYGATYWVATKPYRTMRYIRGRPRNMNPWPRA